MDSLVISDRTFNSRLLLGTGKFSSNDVMKESLEASGTEIDIKDWNVQVIKEDQPTRFYYKVSYVNLE